MSPDQQQQYLADRGYEVTGYMLEGPGSTPTTVEFRRRWYSYRGSPIVEATGGWAIYGTTMDDKVARVLEFCHDEIDAFAMHRAMIRYPEQFPELWIMQFNNPGSKTHHWFSPKYFPGART